VKYPEYKESEEKWVIRQTGVYQRYNTDTHKGLFILLSPTPSSKAHHKAEEWLRNYRQDAEPEPFWLHNIVASTYFPAWRQYIVALELEFLPIVNSTFSTYIDEQLRVGYDNLSVLVSIEHKFLLIPALLEQATDVLVEIDSHVASTAEPTANHPGTQQLKNLQRQCIAYSRTATHLRQRVQTAAQLLANTLSFRDQVMTKQQNENMLKLNKTAVFITTLTLFYLPASFVTVSYFWVHIHTITVICHYGSASANKPQQSFFNMNFFSIDQDNNRIVGTPMIWIFVISATVLTAITFFFYYWLSLRNGVLFRRHVPKVRISSKWAMKHLTQRLRFSGTNTGIELQSSRV
jgi:hypothetical protein